MLLKVRMGMCVNAVSEKIRDSMATVQCELELPKKKLRLLFNHWAFTCLSKRQQLLLNLISQQVCCSDPVS